jgi:hypothetical protein
MQVWFSADRFDGSKCGINGIQIAMTMPMADSSHKIMRRNNKKWYDVRWGEMKHRVMAKVYRRKLNLTCQLISRHWKGGSYKTNKNSEWDVNEVRNDWEGLDQSLVNTKKSQVVYWSTVVFIEKITSNSWRRCQTSLKTDGSLPMTMTCRWPFERCYEELFML